MAQAVGDQGALEEMIPDVYRNIVSRVKSAQSIILSISNMKCDKHVEDFFSIMEVLNKFKITAGAELFMEVKRRKEQNIPLNNFQPEFDALVERLNHMARIVEFMKVSIEERQRVSIDPTGSAVQTVFELFEEQFAELMKALNGFVHGFGFSVCSLNVVY